MFTCAVVRELEGVWEVETLGGTSGCCGRGAAEGALWKGAVEASVAHRLKRRPLGAVLLWHVIGHHALMKGGDEAIML